MTVIELSQLQTVCNVWLDTISTDIQQSSTKIFLFVTGIPSLAAVRDSIWELLEVSIEAVGLRLFVKRADLQVCGSQNEAEASSAADGGLRPEEKVLGHPFSIWEQVLRAIFLQRAQALFTGMFRRTCSQLESFLVQLLGNLTSVDTDISASLWQPEPGDGLPSQQSTGFAAALVSPWSAAVLLSTS